jgi:hypothetical protein
VTLMDCQGTGIIRHIWMTLSDRDAISLRCIKLEMFWEGEAKPAVSVPLGDFFGSGLSHRCPFESAFFRDPEGRSFNCTIPMPFRKHAKIVLTNESKQDITLFYSIAYSKVPALPEDSGYFHAFWNRVPRCELAQDYVILPRVHGKGRFLGANIGIITDPLLKDSWFGEGEVKMYLDGDQDLPTWIGTGSEDYICTAYGQGAFSQMESGCTLADAKHGRWAYYRFHLSDPIYFSSEATVKIQVMGGEMRDRVREFLQSGAQIKVVTVEANGELHKLLEHPMDLQDPSFPNGWTNFYRRDDYSSTAYFYLDHPSSDLPALPAPPLRSQNMESRES